eukprot:6459235-Amphidinium_carterae.1
MGSPQGRGWIPRLFSSPLGDPAHARREFALAKKGEGVSVQRGGAAQWTPEQPLDPLLARPLRATSEIAPQNSLSGLTRR